MARVRVKSSLVVEKITEKLNPEVTEEDYNAELAQIASAYNMTVEKVKESVGEDSEFIKDSIRARKTVEYLASKAVQVEPKEPEVKEEAASEETAEAGEGDKSEE